MAIPNQTGSGFTNVQNFLNANQNNGLGSAIQNGVQGQVNNFNSGLQAGQSQFNSDIDAAKSSIDLGNQGAQSSINDASNLQGGQNLSNQDQTDYNNFTGSSYNGPTSLNNDSQLQSQAGQISNTANQTKTDSGRQGLLQQYAGQGQYTQGEQGVDNLLLNNTGQQALQQTRAIANPVAGTLNNAEANATNQGAQTANYLTGLQQADQNQVQQGYTTRGQNAEQALAADTASNGSNVFNNYLQELNADNGVTQNNAGQYNNQLNLNATLGGILGINNGTDIYNTKGTDLATTLNSAQNLNLAGVTGADQYAQYQALSKLGNNQNNIYNGSDPTQVGQYQGISANQGAVQNFLNQAATDYQNNYNNGNTLTANPNGLTEIAGNGSILNANDPGSFVEFGSLGNHGYTPTIAQTQGEIAGIQNHTNLYQSLGINSVVPGDQANQATLQNQINQYLGSIGSNRTLNYTDSDDPNGVDSYQSPTTFNGIRGRLS